MCRWMAWLGQPIRMEELLFNTPHGIADHSRHSRLAAEPTNGDGFALGFSGLGDGPAVCRRASPAWSVASLRGLAALVESPLFPAHVRAAIGWAGLETNGRPFRHGRWVLVHNG